ADILPGDALNCTASGKVTIAAKSTDPQGLPRGFKDLVATLPVNTVGRGALVGRIGDDEAALPFLIGASRELKSTRAGRLFLGINQAANESADGSFAVKCTRTRSVDATTTGAPAATLEVTSMSDLPKGLLDRIPRRVQDAQGHPGDMVNFLILG